MAILFSFIFPNNYCASSRSIDVCDTYGMRPRTTYKVQSTTHNQGGIETPLAQLTHVTRTKYKGQYCTVWWTARACVGGGCAVFCVIINNSTVFCILYDCKSY